MNHRNCSDALHQVYRECGPPGTDAHDKCMRERNVHGEAASVVSCGAADGDTRVTQCVVAGSSLPQYTCCRGSGESEVAPQTVYGLPLHGNPSRVVRP